MKGFSMNQPNMNQFAMTQSLINSGPFMGNPSAGMNIQGMSPRMDSRGMIGQSSPGYLPRFPGPPHNMGQPNLHPPGPPMIPHGDQQGDSRLSSDKMSLREAVHQLAMETKSIPNKWAVDVGSSGNSSAVMGRNPMPSLQGIEERRNPQNRYNTESATSILASFGLSNEDLEELSRYPDDQLTPENMPVILREIRLRKINRQGPSVSAQNRSVGESVQSKVFDYGHSSKLGFIDEPVQTRVFNDPIDDQRRNDYRGMYTQDNTEERFHTEKSMGHAGFQKEAINKPIFPVTPTNKMSAPSGQNSLSGTQSGLPIEVLNRKLLMNKNTPTSDNKANLQLGTQQMSNIPSFQMTNQSPNFSVGGSPSSYPLGNHPNLQPGGSPMNFPSHADGSMRPPTMPPPAGPASYGKGNWSSRSPQPDPTKTKLLPTPSMMNDYYAASPRIFPHMCSLCNIECKHIKDWIQHQNTTTHIESCRQIRSKYPDWNPQALGALRNEADKDRSPRGHSGSRSSSPRHSRSSGPSHRLLRSRSPDKYTRPRSRSRSPRRAVRRSPRRSRSPRRISRSSPRYRKTSSGERSSRKTSRTPEKKSSDTGQASSKSGAKTELSKNRNGKSSAASKRISTKPESTSLRKPGSESTSTRRPGFAARYPSSDRTSPRKSSANADRTSSKRLPSSSSQKLSSSSTLSKKSSTDAISKKPVSSTSPEEKSVTPTDDSKKNHDKRKSGNVEAVVVPAQTPPPPPPAPKEAYHSLPWFKNKMDPGTVIHITDLPDDGYTDQDILKVVQPFGKASDILIIRCKNEAYLEMSFREAAIAAIKFSETVPVMINKKRIRLSSVGQKPQPAIAERRVVPVVTQKKETVKHLPSKKQATITKPPTEKPPEKSLKPDFSQPKQANKVNPKANNVEKLPEVSKSTAVQKTEDSRKDVPGQQLNVKPMKKELDYGVILVTNFPEKEYTAEEVANLAKPFGGVKDVILLSSHKQAYLQMSQSSAESMIKFYTVFPMSLAGKQLSIKLVPKYKSIKDVERIFIDIIEAEESKPRPEIHDEFVHLKNLPKEGYTDLEVAYAGLRFGKVNNYIVIRNKRKAILHLDSAKNARAMYNFLLNYPCNLANTTLKCTLSPKRKPLPGETVIAEESDAGSDVENIDETDSSQMVSGSAKMKLADTNTDHSSASNIQTSNSKPESKNNEVQPAKTIQKGETEEKVATQSSKPLVNPGGLKKKLLKKKSAVTLEPFAKTLKFKRIALKPKVVKKTKPKGIDTVTDQVQGLEKANKTNTEAASTPELVTDGGVNQSITGAKGTVVDGRKTAVKNEVETGNNDQNRSEKIPPKTSEKNTNKDQTKDELRNPGTTRSGVSKKGISSNQSSATVTAKQGGLTQKITSTKSGEDQKQSSKPDVSKTTGSRNAGKESCTQRPGSSTIKPSMSVSRRNSEKCVTTVQEKDDRGGSRSVAKCQERDDRISTSKDDQSNKSSGKRSPKTSKNTEPKESLEDHEMFPFNMDEFVTVDEIVEETVEEEASEQLEEAGKSPSQITETVKRNESSKDIAPKYANSKKRDSPTASKQDHSFVTVDEVGEEDAFAAQPEASPEDTRQHQTPINEHKKHRHVGKAPHSVMTLDEVSDEEDFVDGKVVGKVQRIATDSTGKRAGLAVGRVKAVEETKASKATCVKAGASKMDVDEPVLVTVDEFNEEDEDFMHNLFSEEHQFVTVDEIGDEDEEDDKPRDEMKATHKSETVNSTKPTSKKGENKKHEGLTSQTSVKPNTRSSTSAKPEDTRVDKSTSGKKNLRSESKSPAGTPKKRQHVETMQEQSNLNTEATDQKAKDASKDIESKRRKLDLPAKLLPYDPKIAVGLEFLIPKTGYFCELCSLFYMDDASKIKHCKTLRHYTCVEKYMAEQQELHLTEDSSSAVQEKL